MGTGASETGTTPTPERMGRYRIERLLGSGGFATVWLGYDETLDARVAIKVLADNWSHNLDIRGRFLEEARILWRADDDRIVRVFAVDELEDGRPYFVMAYADRGNLEERILARRPAGGFAPEEAVRLGCEIAECLEVIHTLGFVHRDLKPSNILFRSLPAHSSAGRGVPDDERMVLGDLGLAKSLANASGYTVTTGTPAYMAPELSNPAGGVDERADQYALGVIIRELVTGESPSVPADSTSGTGDASLGSTVPRPLVEAIRRATLPDREQRFPTLRAFVDALRATVPQPERRLSERASVSPAGNIWSPRRLLALGAGVAALIAGGVAVAIAMRSDRGGYSVHADKTGRLRIATPSEWRSVAAGDWTSNIRRLTGITGSGLTVSPDNARLRADAGTPGIFVGMIDAPGKALAITPRELLSTLDHNRCTKGTEVPLRTVAGLTGYGTRWTCTSPAFSLFEAAVTRGSSAAPVIYIQIKEVAGGDPTLTDRLLNGIKV